MSEEKSASVFGQIIGWTILLAAVIGVIYWFLARPALEEKGYTLEGVKEKTGALKERIGNAADYAENKIQSMQSKTEETTAKTSEKATELIEKTEKKSEVIFEEINLD